MYEKERFEKVGKYPVRLGRKLIFHVRNGNKVFQDLI